MPRRIDHKKHQWSHSLRTAAAHAGTSSTDLLRLWQGDLVEPLLALLPLKAIATVPAVSRRFATSSGGRTV